MAEGADPLHRVTDRLYFADEGARVQVSRHAVDGDVGRNEHTFFLAAVVASGSAEHEAEGERVAVGAGQGLLLRPGAWHRWWIQSPVVIWNVAFTARLVERELAWLATESAFRRLIWSGPMASPAGLVRFDLREGDTDDWRDELSRGGDQPAGPRRIGWLLQWLDRLAAHQRLPGPAEPLHPGVAAAHRAMEADLRRDWDLSALASRAHLAPSYFGRLFRRAFGRPPMAYLARRRAERATELLAGTEKPMATIAAEVGWDDPNYFSRRFREEIGMSPTQYRATHLA